ncbi:hypothetical protein BBK36DRAFT_1115275 [Trichoderma citrinoviride]|uniref:Uncharacterized protein n=1 Tax=Trichoderma citrinoviride TaxID=58853 RepID=A0A2T4BFZ6_9HYPO|nr:hypothetical protein BBK36DRAFT_1115275 [Trichoderma citrinoviride]PTB68246.1 hypothetical protein BBK36DRAFT_1115275 [Trichoderma citrinoviride]
MPAPRSAGHYSAARDGRQDGPATPERRPNSSHEMGKPGNATSQRDDVFSPDDLFHDDDDAADADADAGRLGGGFLLHDAFGGGARLRRQRAAASQGPGLAPQLSSGRDAAFQPASGPAPVLDLGIMRQTAAPSRRSGGEAANSPPSTGNSADGTRFSDVYHQEPHAAADLDSTQIVNMALSLSESRRLAARRSASRTVAPPRLAPIPDASASNNIRQHLQQQRKFSRTESPSVAQEASSGAVVPGSRSSGTFQPSFESSHDPQFRWQFSPSTLARAHKAKVHLELWAQYRRLLDVLPPLQPGLERPLSGSGPDSPTQTSGSQQLAIPLGRQYNPLQYIRNRKVRARERKVIDGKRQGFSDVEAVRLWVDSVYRQMSLAGTSLADERPSIPPYQYAEDSDLQSSPSEAVARSRRPRVDWYLEPCDVIADAYWLEQNGHKYLIEDRHWRKIFPPPPASDLSRPLSREIDDTSSKISPFTTRDNDITETITEGKEFGLSKVRSELSHSSAKERAKQKLQNITGFHHRHGSTGHGHDLLRLKKDSGSDSSDSDSDSEPEKKRRAKPVRKGTISSNSNDLLQKQMMEMVAKEARERELEERALARNESADDGSVDALDARRISQPPSRFASRRTSMAEASDSERKFAVLEKLKQASPTRQSLDVNRYSFSPGKGTSFPNSPEMMPVRNGKSESIASVDPSPPWSRAASPTRNPFSKIKSIIRDKNDDFDDAEDDREGRSSKRDKLARSGSAADLGRRQSSPVGKPLSGADSGKGSRNTGSTRLRGEEGVGLRGMFKGPRIDNVFRGGVSKLGDMIRKKDGPGEAQDFETTDESDSERIRGRKSTPLTLSRKPSARAQEAQQQQQHQPKHFLDTMPQFHRMPSYRHANGGDTPVAAADGSANGRRAAADELKPPVIKIRSASSSASSPMVHRARPGESDVSDSEYLMNNHVSDTVDRRINSTVSLSDRDNHHHGRLPPGQHWSIADRGLPAQMKLSKREVARMRTLILSSGIKAMELRRRANEQHVPFSEERLAHKEAHLMEPGGIPWSDIARLTPEHAQATLQLRRQQVAACDMYPFAARTLATAIQSWGQRWQSSADYFRDKTVQDLRTRVWEVRTQVADDLSEMARKAADEADETSRDLMLGQPLKIKHVIDTMDKMLRTRRRRFRWLRRGLWLTVEWLLVGFMWYVWFMVMILRVFLGVGKGVLRGVKWLLWL